MAAAVRAPGTVVGDGPIDAGPSMTPRPGVCLALAVVGSALPGKVAAQRMNLRWMEIRARFIDRQIAGYRGQIAYGNGDGLMALFMRPLDAVRCAIDLQRDVAAANAATPDLAPVELAIAISAEDDARLAGEPPGARAEFQSRLRDLAGPGGIVVSAAVADRVRGTEDIEAEPLGSVPVANGANQISALRVAYRAIGDQPPALRRAPLRQISLAVLPFRSGAADTRDDYFTEGIAEDIVGALTGVSDLLVVSRTSAAPHQDGDLRAIGRQLAVRYVVTGTAWRSPERLCLRVDLTDTESGAVLWGHRYEVPVGKLFELQADIAHRIARALVPTLGDAELQRSLGKRPENMDAYDLVLQAMYRMYRLDRQQFATASDLLKRAIELDPDQATAYTLLAEWHTLDIGQGYCRDENAAMADLVRLVTSALERNPSDARALALFGHCRAWLYRDYDDALDLFERAFAAGPNSAFAWGWSSPTCSYLGDGASAITHAEYALRLSPHGPHAYFFRSALGLAHYTNGDYEEAARWGRRAMAVNPLYASNLRFLAASLAARGRLQDARSVGRALLALRPDFSIKRLLTRYSYRDSRRTSMLAQHLRLAGLPE